LRSETERAAAARSAAARRPAHDVDDEEIQLLVDEIFARAKFTTRHLGPIATLTPRRQKDVLEGSSEALEALFMRL